MIACTHFLEFHRPGDSRIGQNAGRFLAQALRDGGIAAAIASARSAKGILAELGRGGHDPVAAMQRGNFILLESSEMLSRFSSRTGVNEEQFDRTAGAMLRDAKARAGGSPLRVFGDMVGVLWQRERHHDAVELEKTWIRLQDQVGFELFCAYPVDVFSEQFSAQALEGVLEAHTHLNPSPTSAELGRAFDRAMDEVLGDDAHRVRSLSCENTRHAWPAMPKLEKMILWLRSNLPETADMVLRRALEHYERATPRTYLRQEHFSR